MKLEIKGGPSTNNVEIFMDGKQLNNVLDLTLHPITVNDLITVTMTLLIKDLRLDIDPQNINKKHNIAIPGGIYDEEKLKAMLETLQNATF